MDTGTGHMSLEVPMHSLNLIPQFPLLRLDKAYSSGNTRAKIRHVGLG